MMGIYLQTYLSLLDPYLECNLFLIMHNNYVKLQRLHFSKLFFTSYQLEFDGNEM